MTTDLELRELVELERQAEASPETTERGWQRLAEAVAQGGPGTLSLGTSKTLRVFSAWYAGKWMVGGLLGLALVGGGWRIRSGGDRGAAPPRAQNERRAA